MDVEPAVITSVILGMFMPVILIIGVGKLFRNQPSLIFLLLPLLLGLLGIYMINMCLQVVSDSMAQGYLLGTKTSIEIQLLVSSVGLAILLIKKIVRKRTG